jgi:hypothetical protein
MLGNKSFFPSCARAGPIVASTKTGVQTPHANPAMNPRRTAPLADLRCNGLEETPTCFTARIGPPLRIYSFLCGEL